ncbi:MAG: response regulator [Candidatus Kapabacteria bacterium]|nr:response regulator [Candidatus Kapabacteria bacterium]
MRPYIMVVDDNRITTKLMRRYLEANDFEALEAFDGIDCLEKCKIRDPDAIFMDMMMPRLDGLEAVKALKTDPLTSHVPVTIVSGMSDLKTQQRAVAAGADDFMVKPIDEGLLVSKARILCHYSILQRQVKVLQFALDHTLTAESRQQQKLLARTLARVR